MLNAKDIQANKKNTEIYVYAQIFGEQWTDIDLTGRLNEKIKNGHCRRRHKNGRLKFSQNNREHLGQNPGR